MEEKPIKPLLKSAYNIWPTVKPFVNGGLAGVLTAWPELVFSLAYYSYPRLIKASGDPEFAAQMKKFMPSSQSCNSFFRSIPLWLLAKATYATAQFGSFESLTKKAEAAGDGMLLTLYQEACCGLASGAILACIGIPINSALACLRADVTVPVAQPLRSVFRIIYQKVSNEGVLALWKGGGCYANALMAYNMGMLASYNRSSNYFKESLGFGEDRARLGAGAVSGFFASACSLPFMNVDAIMRSLQRDANISLDCARRVLKLGGPFKFYTGIAKFFAKNTPSIMVTWIFLEEIQKIEESIGL